MNTQSEALGRRVRITNYSPFRGLEGKIQRVHTIEDDGESLFCFYLIALDSRGEPLWFEHTEIEILDAFPLSAPGSLLLYVF